MSTPRTLPEPLLERVHVGDADAASHGIASDDPRLTALRASDAEILAAHPPRVVAALVRERARRADSGHSRWPRLMLGAAPVLACVAAFFLVAREESAPRDDVLEITREKGGEPSLLVLLGQTGQTGDPAVPLVGKARPGAVLQLVTVARHPGHAVVVSIDGRGAVTLHFPSSPTGDTALPVGEARLPQSFELDDAPGFERFLLISSPAPIDVNAVLAASRAVAADAAGRARAPLPLPPALRQTDRLVEKEIP